MPAPIFVDQPAFTVAWNDGTLSPAPNNFAGAQEVMRLKLTDNLEIGDIIVIVTGRYRQQFLNQEIYDSTNTTYISGGIPSNGNKWLQAYLHGDEPAGAFYVTDFAVIHICTITDRLVGTANGGSSYIDLAWGNGGIGNSKNIGVATILRFSGKLSPISDSVSRTKMNLADIALLSQGQQGAGQSDPVSHTVWDALFDLGGYNPHGYSNIYNRLEIGGIVCASYYSSANIAANTPPAPPSSITLATDYSDNPSAIQTPFTILGPYDMQRDPSEIYYDPITFDPSPAAPPPARLWVFYRVVPNTELFNVYGSISPNANDWGATILGLKYLIPGGKLDLKYDRKTSRRYIAAIDTNGEAVIYNDDVKSTHTVSSLTPVIVDSATTCNYPNICLLKDSGIVYTYDKAGDIFWRISKNIGKTWSAAVSVATGFTAHDLIMDELGMFLVIPAFKSADSHIYIITGKYNAGSISWNTPVDTGIQASEVSPGICLHGSVYELTYRDTANAIQIVRCSKLSALGVGAWS